MKLMKCINNHFYDGDVYSQCPHCKDVSDDPQTERIDRIHPPVIHPPVIIDEGDLWGRPSVDRDGNDLGRLIDDINRTEMLIPPKVKKHDEEKDSEEGIYTPPQFFPPDDEGKTIRISSRKEDAKEPLVGWLVGLNGEVYGEGFPLVTGRNYIGRGSDMDVILRGDSSVSRNKHAIIIYEPKSRQFLLQPGESKELFYLDGKVVLDTQVMSSGCELCIGETRLRFIAFCGEDFSWEINS